MFGEWAFLAPLFMAMHVAVGEQNEHRISFVLGLAFALTMTVLCR